MRISYSPIPEYRAILALRGRACDRMQAYPVIFIMHKIGDIVEQGEIAYIMNSDEMRYSVTATIPGIISRTDPRGYPVTKRL